MATGIEMLLKQVGFDPKKIVSDFEQLKDNVTGTLKLIDARLQYNQALLEKLCQKMGVEITSPLPQVQQPEPPLAQNPPNSKPPLLMMPQK